MAARRSARPSEKPANVGGRDMDWHSIAADVRQHFWIYLSLPFVSAVIGYVTKVVAIRMMFQPIDFVGIKPPYLGWQGIIPRNAAKMAGISVDLMTDRKSTRLNSSH